jgi:dihydroorotate dehydrogenase electron transfer subunit
MIIESCTVCENRRIADGIWRLEFSAPGITARYKGPGQFINILPNESWEHPLRRPMSIAEVRDNKVAIIYKVFGPVTRRWTSLDIKDQLNVLGPLGNTFTGWDRDDVHPILVGGGVGLAPILNLHRACQRQGIQSTLIIGARTAGEHFLHPDPEAGILLTTDDGSLGQAGTVIPALLTVLRHQPRPVVFACGPVGMLRAIQELVLNDHVPAQLSVESYMACGVGICQSCVIRRQGRFQTTGGYHRQYSLVCQEGTVYPAEEVSFG